MHNSSHKSTANLFLFCGKIFDGMQQSVRAPTRLLLNIQVFRILCPAMGSISSA